MYHRLRTREPVHLSPFGFYVLSRYADVMALARSPHVTSAFHEDPSWSRRRGGPDSPIVSSTRNWMLMTDGRQHRRVRGLVNNLFTSRSVARLEPRVQQLVVQLLDNDARDPGEELDLISTLALPLPVIVICELLGLPASDREQCRRWTEAIGHVVDPVVTPQMCTAMNDATTDFTAYIADELRGRRRQPREDVLSLLLAAEVDGESLTDEEIVDNVLLLFTAGHETNVNLVGNGLLALLSAPDQLARPVAGGLVDEDVDELLRYDAPVQLVARMTTEDVALSDAVVPRGSKVMLLLGAANRDPAAFPDPDRLDLSRRGAKPASFGGGAHYCIGSLLGKMEARCSLSHLLTRYRVELTADRPDWRTNVNFRGLATLPVLLTPV